MHVYPQVELRKLPSVKPGSLVKYENSFAIAFADPETPGKSTDLAVLYENCFVRSYADPQIKVFDYGHDYILDISSAPLDSEVHYPDHNSGTRLYLSEGGFLIVMLIRHVVNGCEVLDLRTGIGEPRKGSHLPMVEKWSLGFRDPHGEINWMISAPRPAETTT